MSELERFRKVIDEFTAAVETNDGYRLAELFAIDGVYADGFYGEFKGREAIAGMLRDHFWGNAEGFQWTMNDLVYSNGHGYTTYLFRYRSTMPEAIGKPVTFNGMAHYTFEQGLIKRYEEVFNTGMALVQLDFDPHRIEKHLKKIASRL